MCSGCHHLTIPCLNRGYIAIHSVKNVEYRCIIHNISKYEAISLLKIYLLENCAYI